MILQATLEKERSLNSEELLSTSSDQHGPRSSPLEDDREVAEIGHSPDEQEESKGDQANTDFYPTRRLTNLKKKTSLVESVFNHILLLRIADSILIVGIELS